jgi:hypothetical protein
MLYPFCVLYCTCRSFHDAHIGLFILFKNHHCKLTQTCYLKYVYCSTKQWIKITLIVKPLLEMVCWEVRADVEPKQKIKMKKKTHKHQPGI